MAHIIWRHVFHSRLYFRTIISLIVGKIGVPIRNNVIVKFKFVLVRFFFHVRSWRNSPRHNLIPQTLRDYQVFPAKQLKWGKKGDTKLLVDQQVVDNNPCDKFSLITDKPYRLVICAWWLYKAYSLRIILEVYESTKSQDSLCCSDLLLFFSLSTKSITVITQFLFCWRFVISP